MKNMKNNKIILGLKILAFTLIFVPISASADAIHPYQPPVIDHGQYAFPYDNPPAAQPDYTTPTPTPKPPVYNYGSSTTTKTTVVQNQTVPANTYSSTNTTTNTTENETGEYSALAANAVYGSGNFMPSGLVQWVLFGILILIIVILARKISGAEDKYHSTPLKHA